MSSFAPSISPTVQETINPGPPPLSVDYVVIIAMENQNYRDVIGVSFAPFINSLLGTPYFAATVPRFHGGYPGSSAGSYTAVISGDTYGVSDGVGFGSVTGPTIVDGFERVGRTWRVLQESGSPAGNPAWNAGSYRGPDHNGFTQFSNIVNYPVRGRNLLLGNQMQVNPGTLLSLIGSSNPPNFVWYTPNDSNNMHDDCGSGNVVCGDRYLASFVPQILSTPIFRAGKALLGLWWDEFDPAPNVWIGRAVKPSYVSPRTDLGHYSVLRLIENLWGIGPLSNGPNYCCGDIGAVPLDILQ